MCFFYTYYFNVLPYITPLSDVIFMTFQNFLLVKQKNQKIVSYYKLQSLYLRPY
jgi:hypothetical protein